MLLKKTFAPQATLYVPRVTNISFSSNNITAPLRQKIILIFSFLTSFQAREDSSDVKISVGSQLDLGSDSAIEVRSTEQLRRDRQELKAEYKDARKTESKLQSEISRLEERMTQDDNNASLKPGLLHEKETLLEELRRFQSFVRSEGEKVCFNFFSLKF